MIAAKELCYIKAEKNGNLLHRKIGVAEVRLAAYQAVVTMTDCLCHALC